MGQTRQFSSLDLRHTTSLTQTDKALLSGAEFADDRHLTLSVCPVVLLSDDDGQVAQGASPAALLHLPMTSNEQLTQSMLPAVFSDPLLRQTRRAILSTMVLPTSSALLAEILLTDGELEGVCARKVNKGHVGTVPPELSHTPMRNIETSDEKQWVLQTGSGWLARRWLIDFEVDSNGFMTQGVPSAVLVYLLLFTRSVKGRYIDHIQEDEHPVTLLRRS